MIDLQRIPGFLHGNPGTVIVDDTQTVKAIKYLESEGQAIVTVTAATLQTEGSPFGGTIRIAYRESVLRGSRKARRAKAAASSCGCMDGKCETCYPKAER